MPTDVMVSPVTVTLDQKELKGMSPVETIPAAYNHPLFSLLFKDFPGEFAIQLWDKRIFRWGLSPSFTIVFNEKKAFLKLLLTRDIFATAENFINGNIDIRGDLFEAIQLGNYLARQKMTAYEKVSIGMHALLL